jgi:hypothetical protein
MSDVLAARHDAGYTHVAYEPEPSKPVYCLLYGSLTTIKSSPRSSASTTTRPPARVYRWLLNQGVRFILPRLHRRSARKHCEQSGLRGSE